MTPVFDSYEKAAFEKGVKSERLRILAILHNRKKRLPDTPPGHGEEAWLDEIIDEIEGR